MYASIDFSTLFDFLFLCNEGRGQNVLAPLKRYSWSSHLRHSNFCLIFEGRGQNELAPLLQAFALAPQQFDFFT